MIKLIACINNKGTLGRNGELLYHIKNDMENFKSLTIGNVVLMGMNTFMSLPKHKPLPNRINIVLTTKTNLRSEEYDNSKLYFVNSVNGAISLIKHLGLSNKEIFVIGGSSVYEEFLDNDLAEEVYLTIVDDDKDGDVYFPTDKLNTDLWNKIYQSLPQKEGDNTFKFVIYKKNK